MDLKLLLLILLFNHILIDTLCIPSKPESIKPIEQLTKRLSNIRSQVENIVKYIHGGIVFMDSTSSGKMPCIWKICSKPLLKVTHKNKPEVKQTNKNRPNSKDGKDIKTIRYLMNIYSANPIQKILMSN